MTIIHDGSASGGLKVNPVTGAALVEVSGGIGGGGGSGTSGDIGVMADPAAAADGSGNYSVISALKRVLLNGAALLTRIPALVGGRVPADAVVNTFTTKLRDAFQAFPGTNWNPASAAAGDLVFIDGNSAGASYLVVSLDPLTPGTETSFTSVLSFTMPLELATGIHMSQRTLGQEFAVEVVSTEAPVALGEFAISSIQQATTTLTVTTSVAHGLRVGARIGIRGITSDSRLNYPSLVVASTPSETQFTATAGPGGTIQSLNVGPYAGQGNVYQRSAMGGAPNGSSMLLENAVATNASFYVKAEGGDPVPMGGALTGNHSLTNGSTASVPAAPSAALNYSFRPTTETKLALMADRVQWSDVLVDNTGQASNRAHFTQVAPHPDQQYKVRVRGVNQKSLPVPNAQIVSATKAGTTTATVVTAGPHGLTVGDYITAYGSRDTTNFGNITAAVVVASVIDANTFTVVWGAVAATATSYGGFISRAQGGLGIQGVAAPVLLSASRTSNIVTAVASATMVGVYVIGDLVNLVGVRDAATGATLSIDGAYRVRDIQTTSVFLEPVGSTPTGGNIVSTNCGGAFIRRTDLRLSFLRLFEFKRHRVEPLARPASDQASAFPVVIGNTPAVTVSSGTVTTVSTVSTVSAITGGGVAEDAAAGANPIVVGSVIRTAAVPATLVAGDAVRDTATAAGAKTMALGAPVASAEVISGARTASGNSGTISVPTGGALSGNIVVSAVSGTTPTLDLTLEESLDGGVTWQTAWSAPRFTATGNQPIPSMELTGQRRWTWVITGTTPSFTFAVNSNQLTVPANKVRKIFDRTAGVLNGAVNTPTAALYVAGCSNITGKVSIGAATTPAFYQLQVSDDGVNWANVGTATQAIANSSISFSAPAGTVADWARINVPTAGTGQTGVVTSIQATG